MNGQIRAATITRRCAGAIEWPTLGLIAGCYATWLFAGMLYGAAPPVSVLVLALSIVLHSSLQHEAIHRHPTRSERWNETLVSLPLGLLVPYRRYRQQHLAHHADNRLTDPYDDPESFYLARAEWRRLPRVVKALLAWNNTLAGRILIGPAVAAAMFVAREARALLGQRGLASEVRRAWAMHAGGLAAVAGIINFGFAMPLGAYLGAAYLALSLLAVRSFCEHQWAWHPDARSVIVERSALGLLFLNNNLHAVHHARPGLAWYALPAAYRAHRDAWLASNGGYVFQGYGAVLHAFAFRAKEPVAHPERD